MFQLWLLGLTLLVLSFCAMAIIYNITGLYQIKGKPFFLIWLTWLAVAPIGIAWVFVKQAVWFASMQ